MQHTTICIQFVHVVRWELFVNVTWWPSPTSSILSPKARMLGINIASSKPYGSHSVFKIEAFIWVSYRRALKFQHFSWRVSWNPRRQSKNIELKYKTHIKLVHELYGTCFSIMWRNKNQPSIYTSCSDNALRLLVLMAGHIILRTSRDVFIVNLGLRSEGLFWERYILKGQITIEGHWRLQSWTMAPFIVDKK